MEIYYKILLLTVLFSFSSSEFLKSNVSHKSSEENGAAEKRTKVPDVAQVSTVKVAKTLTSKLPEAKNQNYASLKCGSKFLSANDGGEFPKRIDVANLQLYSNAVKDLCGKSRDLVTDRFLLGEFQGEKYFMAPLVNGSDSGRYLEELIQMHWLVDRVPLHHTQIQSLIAGVESLKASLGDRLKSLEARMHSSESRLMRIMVADLVFWLAIMCYTYSLRQELFLKIECLVDNILSYDGITMQQKLALLNSVSADNKNGFDELHPSHLDSLSDTDTDEDRPPRRTYKKQATRARLLTSFRIGRQGYTDYNRYPYLNAMKERRRRRASNVYLDCDCPECLL